MPFHRQYLTLVEEIERRFPVACWTWGDVEIWPLARMDLYLDMYRRSVEQQPPRARSAARRVAGLAARPLANLWKSRHDLRHRVARPQPSHAIFLGDGVSLDRIGGVWQDRFGEALMAAYDRRGLRSFLMQAGDLDRLPWLRPTFAANIIARWGSLAGMRVSQPAALPALAEVRQTLSRNGVLAPSLDRSALTLRASAVSATATAFEGVLRKVKPRLAFVVTYYAGLGPAFLLACRRQGVLSVDLQHCPQEGAHKAYRWSAIPARGYATLPAVFWNWTERDASDIGAWCNATDEPWHRSLHGGYTQCAPFVDGESAEGRRSHDTFRAMGKDEAFAREILVALQPIAGLREKWNELAAQIESSPPDWRWWIRRHPASHPGQDAEFGRLLSLRRTNVRIDGVLDMPLPALLLEMGVLLSMASGAAAEAEMFGVPALFLSEAAREPFGALLDRGAATIVDVQKVNATIASLPARSAHATAPRTPDIDESLLRLEEMADRYAALCRVAATLKRHGPAI